MSKKSENLKLVSSAKAARGRIETRNLPDAPPAVVRLVAEYARMKGPGEQDYWELVKAIATDVAAVGTLDYMAVIEIAEETFAILLLRKTKNNIIECMRSRRADQLALEECKIASEQRGAAVIYRSGYNKFMEGGDDTTTQFDWWVRLKGNPMPPEQVPPYHGFYSKSDIAEFAVPADEPADDGQAFLDAMDALERVDVMISFAQKRLDKALDDIVSRRRGLGERLRASSNRIIDGTVNTVEGAQ